MNLGPFGTGIAEEIPTKKDTLNAGVEPDDQCAKRPNDDLISCAIKTESPGVLLPGFPTRGRPIAPV